MNARLLRPAVAFLVLAAASCVVSGCGGSGPSAGSAASSKRAPIPKARAAAYARAVNLRAGDLPLASVFEAESEAKRSDLTPHEKACERAGHGANQLKRRIIDRHSATLGWNLPGEFQRIYSAVEVLPTAALTVRHNAANRSSRALTCAARFLPSILEKVNTGRVEFRRATVSRAPDPSPGIEGAYEFRIAAIAIIRPTASVEAADYLPQRVKRIRFYMNFFGFIDGPAEINLTALSAPRPVPKKLEDRLLVLLYSRATTHRL